ncbi:MULTISPECIES: hypothetical protein [Paenibacillus]|nr:hypothetical protein [Paenibacillus caseinilyticus]
MNTLKLEELIRQLGISKERFLLWCEENAIEHGMAGEQSDQADE